MEKVAQIGRAWMLDRIPAHHRFIIKSTLPHGLAAAMNSLRGVGYNYATAKQLCLAHKEQQEPQDEAGKE